MEKVMAGMYRVEADRNGIFSYWKEEKKIISFYGQAILKNGKELDTRKGRLHHITKEHFSEDDGEESVLKAEFEAEDNTIFIEEIRLGTNGDIKVTCIVKRGDGKEIMVKTMTPLVTEAPDSDSLDFLKSLWTKMLLVPYDNTMWVRYEAVPLRPGRRSFDVTAIFQEKSREGLVIGALDFDLWKNGILCSGSDARVLHACCGISDMESHDFMEHGIVKGKEVTSSAFLVQYGEDYRDLLEKYGEYVKKTNEILPWEEGVPFGWNSWSGLAFRLNDHNYRESGRFLKEELMEGGYENHQTTYVNLDAGWNTIPEEKLIALVEELHSNNQKAGIYGAPFAWFGKNEEDEIPGVKGHCYKEILLRDNKGEILPRVDGAIPMDVTHPLWKQHIEWQTERFLKWGFDYVKLDFLSHGAMEGIHYDKKIMTGRQAITKGYEFLVQHLSEEKAGRPFFISLSIAPLFPCGYGHARRFSCDAFGLDEDVEYVLNALTYAWWQSDRLYAYNDPDHISLYRSFCGERNSLMGEARARYTASVISGTVMMLSDDYGMGQQIEEVGIEVREARERTRELSRKKEINQIAAIGKSFRPVESSGTTACNFFTLTFGNKQYAALFHWEKEKEKVEFDFERAGFPMDCQAKELWSGTKHTVLGGRFSWEFDGCDAILLEIM